MVAVVAGLTVAAAMQERRGRAARALLESLLDSREPEVRRAAVAVVAQGGLGRHGAALVRLSQRETDPVVRDELVVAVTRNQWEPADSSAVVELRLWAQRELLRRPLRTALEEALGEAVLSFEWTSTTEVHT